MSTSPRYPYLAHSFKQIADWVAESVLSKEDSRKRATAVKQLISVADVSTLIVLNY